MPDVESRGGFENASCFSRADDASKAARPQYETKFKTGHSERGIRRRNAHVACSDEIDTRERMLDAALGSAGRGPDRLDVTGPGSRPEGRSSTKPAGATR